MRLIKFILLGTLIVGTPLFIAYQGSKLSSQREESESIANKNLLDSIARASKDYNVIREQTLKYEIDKIKDSLRIGDYKHKLNRSQVRISALMSKLESLENSNKRLETDIMEFNKAQDERKNLASCVSKLEEHIMDYSRQPPRFNYSGRLTEIELHESILKSELCYRIFEADYGESSKDVTTNKRTSKKKNRAKARGVIMEFLVVLDQIERRLKDDLESMSIIERRKVNERQDIINSMYCLGESTKSYKPDYLARLNDSDSSFEIIKSNNVDHYRSAMSEVNNLRKKYEGILAIVNSVEDTKKLRTRNRLGDGIKQFVDLCQDVSI